MNVLARLSSVASTLPSLSVQSKLRLPCFQCPPTFTGCLSRGNLKCQLETSPPLLHQHSLNVGADCSPCLLACIDASSPSSSSCRIPQPQCHLRKHEADPLQNKQASVASSHPISVTLNSTTLPIFAGRNLRRRHDRLHERIDD